MSASSLRRCAAIAALTIGLVPAARAGAPDNITPEERALLPPICSYTQLAKGAALDEYRRLTGIYGHGLSHIHHYCWGVIYRMRMYKPLPGKRRGLNKYQGELAVAEIDYVLTATAEDKRFPFRPELLATRARILADLGDPSGAASTARQLLSEWPELAQGYIILADMLVRMGKRAEAIAVLEKGEQAVTDKSEFHRLRKTLQVK